MKKKNQFPLQIQLETNVKVKLGSLKTKKVGIRVFYDGIDANIPKGNSTATEFSGASSNPNCQIKLPIKMTMGLERGMEMKKKEMTLALWARLGGHRQGGGDCDHHWSLIPGVIAFVHSGCGHVHPTNCRDFFGNEGFGDEWGLGEIFEVVGEIQKAGVSG